MCRLRCALGALYAACALSVAAREPLPPNADAGPGQQLEAPQPGTREARWNRLLQSLAAAGERERVSAVNDWINDLPWVSDRQQWRVDDYWATPAELLRAGGGDCEDLALAKYVSLRRLGIPARRMELVETRVLVHDPRIGRLRSEAHLVLVVHLGDVALVLDNVRRDIVPLAQRRDLARHRSLGTPESPGFAAAAARLRRVAVTSTVAYGLDAAAP
jgi:predicted transglutaminase-like cysteine proteinase